MKPNKALSAFFKQIFTLLKTKTRHIKTRFVIFSLLRNRRILIDSISHKFNNLLHNQDDADKKDDGDGIGGRSKAIVLYSDPMAHISLPNPTHLFDGDYDYEDNDDKYPDLTHTLFDSDFEDPGGSVIDLVKNSKQHGEEFSLEEEIDHVADLFIKRFHRQMRMEKQNSIKRYQEMLDSSA